MFYDEYQQDQLKEAFSFFDRSGDLLIDVKEFGECLQILGENPTKAEV